jgi:hypothetical protein
MSVPMNGSRKPASPQLPPASPCSPILLTANSGRRSMDMGIVEYDPAALGRPAWNDRFGTVDPSGHLRTRQKAPPVGDWVTEIGLRSGLRQPFAAWDQGGYDLEGDWQSPYNPDSARQRQDRKYDPISRLRYRECPLSWQEKAKSWLLIRPFRCAYSGSARAAGAGSP